MVSSRGIGTSGKDWQLLQILCKLPSLPIMAPEVSKSPSHMTKYGPGEGEIPTCFMILIL